MRQFNYITSCAKERLMLKPTQSFEIGSLRWERYECYVHTSWWKLIGITLGKIHCTFLTSHTKKYVCFATILN